MISDACAPYLFTRTHSRSLVRSHARSLTEACGHGFAEAHLDLVGLWQHRRCSPAGALRKLGRLFARDLLAPMPRCSQTSLSRLLSTFTLALHFLCAREPALCARQPARAHQAHTQGPHRDDTGTWATSWGGGGGAPSIDSPPTAFSPLGLLRCTLDCRVSSVGALL